MKVIICHDGRVIPWHAVLSFFDRSDGFVWACIKDDDAVCVGPMFKGDAVVKDDGGIIEVIRRHTEEV